MSKHATTITVQDVPVTVMQIDQNDYISLTDMAKARTDAARAADVIKLAAHSLDFGISWYMGSDVQSQFQSGRIRPL